MTGLVVLSQLSFLIVFAFQDVARRRLDNLPILLLLVVGLGAAFVDGFQWTGWNFALPAVALIAYRFRQIGGADAKVLFALLPMAGPWVPWFLLGAFLGAVGLHLALKRPPLLVALASSYASLALWAGFGGGFA